ncbi:unnamed protein product, partial [Lymnaea stagnalis]
PRASICAKLITFDTRAKVCTRLKRCGSDADCFSPNGCCVYNIYATADVTSPPAPDYYKYPPSSKPGQIVPPLVGVCLPAFSLDNPCAVSIDPLSTNCPCLTGLTCQPDVPGSIIGTCVDPAGLIVVDQ